MHLMFICYGTEQLGVEYLSSILKLNGHKVTLGFEPALFDDKHYLRIPFLHNFFKTEKYIMQKIKDTKPDIVGFSVVTNVFTWALNLARLIKENYNIPIVFGGIHPTALPERVLDNEVIDYVIRGEGEESVLELVNGLKNKSDLCSIRNLCFRKGDAIIKNPVRNLIEDLDLLPFPDKDLFNEYIDVGLSYKILTSRGCLFHCHFCSNDILFNLYKDKGHFVRKRSVDNVLEELVLAKLKHKLRMVEFEDDIFTFNLSWLEEFSNKYKKKIGIPFKCLAHPKFINKDIANLLKKAGCYRVQMGIQTMNESLRRVVLNRPEKNKEILDALEICKKYSLDCVVDHLFGIPGDSEDDYKLAADVYNRHRKSIVKIKCFYMNYFPGTSMVDIGLKNNILSKADLDNIHKGLFNIYYLPNDTIKKNVNNYNIMKSFEVFYKILPLLSLGFYNFLLKFRLYRIFRFCPRSFIYFSEIIVAIKKSDYTIIPYLKHYFHQMYDSRIKIKLDIQKNWFYLFKRYFIIFNIFVKKPILMLRCVKHFLIGSIFKCALIKKVEIGLTYDCQCNCERCSSYKMKDSLRPKLSLKEFKRLAKECLNLGALQINFTGGEPLLREDILQIVNFFNPQKTFISINTNSLLLNEGKIRELRDVGVDMIKISIDSPVKEEHDEMRGKEGCFKNALRTIELVKRIGGMQVQISTVPTHDSLVKNKVWQLLKLAESHSITLGLVLPAKAGRWSNKKRMLVEEDKLILKKLFRHHLVVKDTHTGRLKVGCPAGKEGIYITCYGDITPCPHIQISFGNIRNTSLKAIWERMRTHPVFFKKNKFCLASEDEEFMDKYLEPIKDVKKMPIDIKVHPTLK